MCYSEYAPQYGHLFCIEIATKTSLTANSTDFIQRNVEVNLHVKSHP